MKANLNLKKVYFLALIIIAATKVHRYFYFYGIPFKRLFRENAFDEYFGMDEVRKVCSEFIKFFDQVTLLLLLIGFYVCFKKKKLEFNRYIMVFVCYVFANTLIGLFTILVSSNIPFDLNIYSKIYLGFFIVTAVYFAFQQRDLSSWKTAAAVTKKSRFWNYALDTFVFSCLFIFSVFAYTQEGRPNFEYLGFFGTTHFLYLAVVFKFIYYLTAEFLFRTTVGKLHSNSVVIAKDRFESIFIRTIVRFFPFEPFSFFSKEGGWHDKFSKTKVVRKDS